MDNISIRADPRNYVNIGTATSATISTTAASATYTSVIPSPPHAGEKKWDVCDIRGHLVDETSILPADDAVYARCRICDARFEVSGTLILLNSLTERLLYELMNGEELTEERLTLFQRINEEAIKLRSEFAQTESVIGIISAMIAKAHGTDV